MVSVATRAWYLPEAVWALLEQLDDGPTRFGLSPALRETCEVALEAVGVELRWCRWCNQPFKVAPWAAPRQQRWCHPRCRQAAWRAVRGRGHG